MSADWTIKIVKSGKGAAFVPDLSGAQQGTQLRAQQDDLVTWNNETNDVHQPWQTDSSYKPLPTSNLSGPIPAGQSSNNYDCAAPIDPQNPKAPPPQTWTVYYYCNRHPDNPLERGSILVAAAPTSGVNILPKGTGAILDPQSVSASANDLLSWNNVTKNTHQPWPTNAQHQPLQVSKGSPGYISDPIPAGESSLTYLVAEPKNNPTPGTWTVYYYCKVHPTDQGEQGTIVVVKPSS